jgi:hypothetical protein
MPKVARLPVLVDLVHRPLFPTRPMESVKDAFLAHVAASGCPETFPSISTTEPPADGALKVLTKFGVVSERRWDRGLAPCPICNPHYGQFGQGVLIWCEADWAIYAVGFECATRLWKDDRLDQAVNEYERVVRQTNYEDALLDRLPHIPQLRRWIARHSDLAAAVDDLVKSFRKSGPLLRKDLARVSRGEANLMRERGAEALVDLSGRVAGASFLTVKPDLVKKLELCDLHLGFVDYGEGVDACLEAVCRLDLVEMRKADHWIRSSSRTLRELADRMAAAADFLAPGNLRMIHDWGQALARPIHASGDARHVRIDRGGEIWFSKLERLRSPDPLDLP